MMNATAQNTVGLYLDIFNISPKKGPGQWGVFFLTGIYCTPHHI